MRLKLIYAKLFMIFILLSLFIFSCATSNVGNDAVDPPANEKIVSIAYSLTDGCPAYFIPLEVYTNRFSKK